MSLARGEETRHEVTSVSPRPAPGAVLIAIAASAEERERIARLFGAHASVLLVSSREEAVALLSADASPSPPAPPPPQPEDHGDTPAEGLVLDSDWRTASWRGRSVPLSPLEHDVLHCLLADLGHTWTFEELHQRVWGNNHLGDRSDMQSVVKRLRRKLGFLGSPLRVQAIRGVGFRLARSASTVG